MSGVLRRTSTPGMGIVLAGLVAITSSCAPRLASNSKDAPPVRSAPVSGERLKVLFLGDGGHHKPAERLRDIATPLLDRGIELYYTEDLNDLELEKLRGYDAVLLYANHEGAISPAQEEALVTYVAEGGGFVPIHSASGNFRGSRRFIELVGGAFQSHGEGIFRTRIAEPTHEIMQGYQPFESWDETYVHQSHATTGRTVLAYRDDEPYTWTRTHGKGRVFYTALGHDERTWRNPGFQELLERGIRWAAGQDVQRALATRSIEKPFDYAVLDVPFPPPHRVRTEYEQTKGPMDRRSNYPLFYQMQLPLSPEESIRRMVVPPGFRVELFAAEPDVIKPIAMSWDERGRLWVVESVEYPYPRELWPDSGGKDRIRILEDTDNDGRADRFTLFADGLNIPTAITFAGGGVIVHQAPQTLFLRDTNGDDRADEKRVLFEGWSQRDTHAGPSNLHYGLDNWIWGVLGYSGFEGTIGGERHAFSQGVYRFRPDGSKLEFLRRTSNNTWGLGFNEQGGAFISTANGNPSTYLQFPRRGYARVPELSDAVTEALAPSPRFITLSNEFRQVDWVGAYTAGAGHAIYTARSYPREYWNRIGLVNEPTGHLVGEFLLEEKGSSYRAPHPRNLIASDDQWFSPVVAEVGPDGQVWIADWYNYVIQHNAESDRQRPAPGNAYANPLRDRQHGRIYRIVYEGAPKETKISLAGASPQRLVQTLRHHNLLWRKHAQRLLVERGQPDVVPALVELAADPRVDEVGLDVGAIHALWTLHGLGQLDGRNAQAIAAARAALRHPSAGVRRNAIQVLPRDPATAEAIQAAGLLEDANPQVRLEALVALADLPPSEPAGRAIYTLLARPANMQDQWIREAATIAAAVHNRGFLAAAASAGKLAEVALDRPEPENLLPNPGFESMENGRPAGWAPALASGAAEATTAPGEGRNGGTALKIASRAGGDASWTGPSLQVKPNMRYQIGAWMRTKEVDRGTGRGAVLNLNGVPAGPVRVVPVPATSDWTFQTRTLTSTAAGTATFQLALGGGGHSTGELWIDDVVLKELGPEPGTTLEGIVELVYRRDPTVAASLAAGSGTPVVAAGGVAVLAVGVIPDVLRFDRTELRVRAGQQVRVTFTNTDNMEHNLVFIMPGSLARVGTLADQLALSPQGRQQNYVPDTPDVFTNTPVLEPAAKFELAFTAPTTPGRYTYVCTIPGHWRVMQGTLIVEPA